MARHRPLRLATVWYNLSPARATALDGHGDAPPVARERAEGRMKEYTALQLDDIRDPRLNAMLESGWVVTTAAILSRTGLNTGRQYPLYEFILEKEVSFEHYLQDRQDRSATAVGTPRGAA